MKVKNVKMVSVQEWDKLVKETYGKPYSFQQQDGCKDRGTFEFDVPVDYDYIEFFENDAVPEVVNGNIRGVSFEAWQARDPKQPLKNQKLDFELSLWWERNFYPDVQMVANDLHKRGLLDAGEYVIDIDW